MWLNLPYWPSVCKERSVSSANNRISWSNLELLALFKMNACNICLQCKSPSLSCSRACLVPLSRWQNPTLAPEWWKKENVFCHFFTALFIQLCLTAKAIRAPRLNPPAARSVCLCRSDCSTECRTRWCSLQKQTSRGAAENTGTCSVPTAPSASLHCCLFYSRPLTSTFISSLNIHLITHTLS